MKIKWNDRELWTDIAYELAGDALIAAAMYNFALHSRFPMTGFSGIAMILYRLFGLPIGLTTIVLNIPVAILCYKLIGREFLLKSLRCMITSSVMIDWIAPLFPVYEGDRMISALVTGTFGGIVYGMIINFLFAVAVDRVMCGFNAGRLALIVTEHGEELCECIDECSGRGSTILEARGGYRQDRKQVVMVACSHKEMYQI